MKIQLCSSNEKIMYCVDARECKCIDDNRRKKVFKVRPVQNGKAKVR